MDPGVRQFTPRSPPDLRSSSPNSQYSRLQQVATLGAFRLPTTLTISIPQHLVNEIFFVHIPSSSIFTRLSMTSHHTRQQEPHRPYKLKPHQDPIPHKHDRINPIPANHLLTSQSSPNKRLHNPSSASSKFSHLEILNHMV